MNYEDSDWHDDDFGDDDYSDDDYGEDDFGDDDEVDTIPCPDCGADVYEEADACPACGCYLHHGYRAGGHAPWWSFGGAIEEWSPMWVFLAMTGVIAVIFTLMLWSF